MMCVWCGWSEEHSLYCPTHRMKLIAAWLLGHGCDNEPGEAFYTAVAEGSAWHTAWLMGWTRKHE